MQKLYLIRDIYVDEYDLFVWAKSAKEAKKLWVDYFEMEDATCVMHEIPALDQSTPARVLAWEDDVKEVGDESDED